MLDQQIDQLIINIYIYIFVLLSEQCDFIFMFFSFSLLHLRFLWCVVNLFFYLCFSAAKNSTLSSFLSNVFYSKNAHC